jgi:23S rRNA (cytidine1920-2'-O)/16S rRNA (cytidine1409-2'-O)-methyltransferase
MVTGVKGKERLDKLLVSLGLARSREQARGLILSGAVIVDGRTVSKVGTLVSTGAAITLRESALPQHGLRYVGRGGLKLEGALSAFEIHPDGWVAVDIGASTGGFTDCLLQHGAIRVYAVDVGYGQLAWRLRQDSRVVVLERTHIRDLSSHQIPERVDLVTIDVSFISLSLVLPKAAELVKPGGRILALVKPQFEVGRGEVGKGGIVRDPGKRKQAVERIRKLAEGLGLSSIGVYESPVKGRDGNIEYFILLKKERVNLRNSERMRA